MIRPRNQTMPHTNGLHKIFLLGILLPLLAFAQFQWPQNGVAIRQGAHLGWSGAVVATGNDVSLFYYDCLRDGTRDVMGTRISPSGNHLWGDHGRLVSGNISEQRAPVVAAYADGSVIAVWEDYATGRYRDLMAQRYDAEGNAMWSPAGGVTVIEAYRDQFDVRLAVNAEGFAFIAFTDDRLTTGANTRLGAYAQVLTPDGERVGPLDGIRLVDRIEGYNVPVEARCVGNDAYILVTLAASSHDLVIQKLTPTGEIGFPGDEPSAEFGDYGRNSLLNIDNGLAFAWTDHSASDTYGDARMKLLDLNRDPLPGWTNEGTVIASGENTQSVMNLTEAPDGSVVIAIGDFNLEADEANLVLYSYSRAGALNWGPVNLGSAALRTSPVDWYWQGDDLVVIWTETVNYTDNVVHTQKLNAAGVKQWGDDGRLIWSRANKKLRAEIEKPASGPARVVVISGRVIAQPESLFVGELSSSGELLGNAEFISGGWTYDSYDVQVARIDEQKIATIWTDDRSKFDRDVYYQLVDANGNAMLEPQGRKLEIDGTFSIYAPPAIAADGAGGAFLCWIGDSVSSTNVMHIHRVDGDGNELWNEPARVRSQNGYYGQTLLVPDGNGGVFAAFSRFNESFVARISVAHVNANGEVSWLEGFHEFPGTPGNDATLNDAISDGQGGCYLTGITGPWTDTNPVVFHVRADGSFGENWTNEGRVYGGLQEQDRNADLLLLDDHVLLTYERPIPNEPATYDVRGVLVGADGAEPWGALGRRLSAADAAVVKHVVTSDGQGGFLLGYSDFRNGSETHLYVAKFDANGLAQWAGVERLICTDPLNQDALAMMHDNQGGAWLMWEDVRNSDIYTEIDLYATHMNSEGEHATVNGFSWPAEGYPVCAIPTYQQHPVLLPWANGSVLALWKDLRSSNPGRCCGAGSVGDIFQNIYAQVLSETSLDVPEVESTVHPTTFDLSAYPNPFNPSTQLNFTLPQNANVKLSIYNVLGQQTEVLFDAPVLAGNHAINWDAAEFPSGIYFAKLETSTGLSTVQKLTLLK